MYDGLWTVEFISTIQRYGNGVLVLNQNRLFGGDAGYYYSGKYDINDKKIEGDIHITRYDRNSVSVLGSISDFVLKMSGNIIDENRFEAIGEIDNNPKACIQIIGTKKEDL
ncbi:MAG: hypothetical protein JRJ49_06415 [Deltaproteobacteria bacterium]|nr:hypothetical protein [Deltaproteobacteria bacterium]